MNKSFKKSIILGIIAILVAVVSLTSCDLFKSDINYGDGFFDDGGYPVDDPETDNIVPAPDFEFGEHIAIDKNPGLPEHWNGVTSAGDSFNKISEVFYAVSDSVVEITTELIPPGGFLSSFVSEGAGSGVIISAEGFIVTNHHVIDGAANIIVRLTDGSQYRATLVGSDQYADIAVLKIAPGEKELTVARLGCSDDLVVGEDIIVIGNPLGSLGGTLTTGIISAKERNIVVDGIEMTLLQTNAAINPGNSGGGLFNMAGELVGIVNAKMAGEDVEGLGFAIPIDYAHGVIEDLLNYGYVVTE